MQILWPDHRVLGYTVLLFGLILFILAIMLGAWPFLVANAFEFVATFLLAALGALTWRQAVDYRKRLRQAETSNQPERTMPETSTPLDLIDSLQWPSEEKARRDDMEELERAGHREGLRLIRESEKGLRLRELPPNVYCFVDTVELASYRRIPHSRWTPVLEGDLSFAERLSFAAAELTPPRFSTRLEVHRDNSRRHFLVGFVPELDATKIENDSLDRVSLYLGRAEHASRAVRIDAQSVERVEQVPTTPTRWDLILAKPQEDPPDPKSTEPPPPSSPGSS